MTTTQQGLLILLKSALTGKKLLLPEGFRLEDADELIRNQSLLPLAFQGAYQCGISPKTELMQQYQKQYYRILMHSERQMNAVRQIFQVFEENGIDYMPLKGCNMKLLYPQPEMRMMGDADILIRMEQYEIIKPIMLQLGYQEGTESQHELVWDRKDLHVELHKCLTPPSPKGASTDLGDGWSMAQKMEGHRYALSPEDEFVFLFAHMTKHYRSYGIGCRQFLDLYLYKLKHPQLDEVLLEEKFSKLRLVEFYRNTCHMLSAWFEGGPEDQKTELMTRYILSGGNWGDYETLLQSRQAEMSSNGESTVAMKRKALWSVLFPPLQVMQVQFKILFKIPWLYPLFWIVRWVRLIACNHGTVLRKLRLINSLSDTKVNARREALHMVGLDPREE